MHFQVYKLLWGRAAFSGYIPYISKTVGLYVKRSYYSKDKLKQFVEVF